MNSKLYGYWLIGCLFLMPVLGFVFYRLIGPRGIIIGIHLPVVLMLLGRALWKWKRIK